MNNQTYNTPNNEDIKAHANQKKELAKAFDKLKSQHDSLCELSTHSCAVGYFAQEALRFISIADTILETINNPSKGNKDDICRVLLRSILDGFFKIVYIYDDFNEIKGQHQLSHDFQFFGNIEDKYQKEVINEFKRTYYKLLGENIVKRIRPKLPELKNSPNEWRTIRKPQDARTWLTHSHQIADDSNNTENDEDAKPCDLSFLYFTYRVASFDTHANGNLNVYEAAFEMNPGDQNKPFFHIDYDCTIKYIAQEYYYISLKLSNLPNTPR